MISFAGKLIQATSKEQVYTFDINQLQEGFNATNELIIHKQDGQIKYIINRTCDHNGGKLIPKNNIAACPLHNWRLNLDTLEYSDSFIKKKTLNFTVIGNSVTVQQPVYSLKMQVEGDKANTAAEVFPNIEVVFLSHACVYIQAGDFSMITDPWLMGPAFMNGWWLNKPPKAVALEYVKKAKMLYISHNHPDHLHPETLEQIFDKDKFTITPDFSSGSSEKMLKRSGFKNIKALPFKELYQWKDEPIYFSILKSGDFRDDSGLYLNIYGFEILMTVDSNFLNGFVLPEKLDLLLSSFVSGAGGYPLCFETLTEEQKTGINDRNRAAAMVKVSEVIRTTNPTYYVPYAGYFIEKAERDNYIKIKNIKSSVEDVVQYIKKARPLTTVLNPQEFDKFVFTGKTDVIKENISSAPFYQDDTSYINAYISAYREEYTLNNELIINYFSGATFRDNLEIFIVPSNDVFEPIGQGYFIDFSQRGLLCVGMDIAALESKYQEKGENKKEWMYVRVEAFMCVIKNKLPWEDMSIGFQCRFKRIPDVYNAEFWHYFTNVYIGEEHFRYDSYCGGACTKLHQKNILF